MMLAGFETTASTLTFAAYLLAKPCNAEKQVRHPGPPSKPEELHFSPFSRKLAAFPILEQ